MARIRITLLGLGALAVAAPGAAGAVGDVRINEIRVDQPSTDNDEYFELAGPPGQSLDGLTYVVIGDGSAAQGSVVIEAVVSLNGRAIAADGFFLVAETSFTNVFAPGVPDFVAGTSLNFENDDNFTHLLVQGFAGTNGQDLDTNDDGTLDVTPWSAVVDSVALVKSLTSSGTERFYSATTVGPDGSFVPGHAFRLPDGTGTWRIGNFNGGEDSPGSANSLTVATDAEIHDIQGAGHVSPLVSEKVRTRGIVIAKDTNGFWIQDPSPDADDATSEGLFVFTSSAPSAAVGDDVQVEGVVAEFTPGGVATGNLANTELVSPTITTLSTGNPLPAATTIGPSGRTPPTQTIDDDALATFDPASDGLDFYESLEGMRVLVPSPAVIAPTNRFGEIWVLSAGGSGATGRNPRGGITLTEADANPERIQVQVGEEGLLANFDPQVQVGDALGDVVGVVSYDFGQFQVVATQTFSVTAGTLAPEVTSLVGTCDGLTVATFNVLNLDPNDDDGDDDVANGQFDRLAEQLVASLRSPDVVVLEEVQDDSGSEDDGTTGADLTLATLIDAIVEAGGPEYEAADVPPADGASGGQPGGNIRVAFLWNPERTALVAGSLRAIADPNLLDGDAFANSRRPLAGEFSFNARRVTVIGNHWSSKGGSTPLFGRVQPPVNGSVAQRTAQAGVVRGVVDALLAADPHANVVVAGDLNEFGWNEPLAVLRGVGATALTDLVEAHPILERYSYVFEGNAQALDHVFVSPALAALAEHDLVHVNAEFVGAASDHDPEIARLALAPPSGAEILAFFDASVAGARLAGVSASPAKAAKECELLRKRIELLIDAESRGDDAAAIDHLRNALKWTDGASSPPDLATGAALPHLVEMLGAALAGHLCD